MYNIYVITAVTSIFLAVITLIGTKKNWNTFDANGYLSKVQTNWLRGIGAVAIVLSHYYPAIKITEVGMLWQLSGIGIWGVAIFLLLSGYGAMYSKINKADYLKGYLYKRAVRLYVPFLMLFIIDIALLFILKQQFFWKDLIRAPLLSLHGTLNWYLKVQLGLYIVFYICAKLIKNDNKLIITLFVLCFIYMIIGYITKINNYWYESSYMFPLGMLIAKYKDKIYEKLNKKYAITIIASILIMLIFYAPYYLFGGAIFEILAIFGTIQFTLCVCVKTYGDSKFTALLGTLSLEIYLSHTVLGHVHGYIDYKNSVASFLTYMAFTIILSYAINKLSNLIINKRRTKNAKTH